MQPLDPDEEKKNGISIFEINQSSASWSANNINGSKLFGSSDTIFQEYVTNTLLSMGFNQSQIDRVLPELVTGQKAINDMDAIDKAIALINPPASVPPLDEEEEKEAIIRQRELHFESRPMTPSQICEINPELKTILMEEVEDLDVDADAVECIICREHKPKDAMWQNLCKHYGIVCISCVAKYFRQNILEGKVEICCLYPGCPEFIPEEQILLIIADDYELVTKYKRFEMNLRQSRNANLRWCPSPDCQQTALVFDKSDPCYVSRLECTSCGTAFCAECNLQWHEGRNCQEAKQTRRGKMCPKCQSLLFRMGESNRMTCHCRHEFCWICDTECTAKGHHWKAWNLKGCPAAEQYEGDMSPMRGCLRKLNALLLCVPCVPLLLIGCVCSRVCNSDGMCAHVEKNMASCFCC